MNSGSGTAAPDGRRLESSTMSILRKMYDRHHMTDSTKALIELMMLRARGYGEDARKYSRSAFLSRVVVAAVSAATTIVLGLKSGSGGWDVYLQNLALVLSAAVTVFASFDSIFGMGERAVAAETARRTIRRLSYEMYSLTAIRDLTEAEREDFARQFHQTMFDADNAALVARRGLAAPVPDARR